jgi:hypothetical protein
MVWYGFTRRPGQELDHQPVLRPGGGLGQPRVTCRPLAVLLCNVNERRHLAARTNPKSLKDSWTIAGRPPAMVWV